MGYKEARRTFSGLGMSGIRYRGVKESTMCSRVETCDARRIRLVGHEIVVANAAEERARQTRGEHSVRTCLHGFQDADSMHSLQNAGAGVSVYERNAAEVTRKPYNRVGTCRHASVVRG